MTESPILDRFTAFDRVRGHEPLPFKLAGDREPRADIPQWQINRTNARWFQNYCLGREIHFIKGRLKFGGSKSNAPFGCCVVVFRPTLNDVKWGAA